MAISNNADLGKEFPYPIGSMVHGAGGTPLFFASITTKSENPHFILQAVPAGNQFQNTPSI